MPVLFSHEAALRSSASNICILRVEGDYRNCGVLFILGTTREVILCS